MIKITYHFKFPETNEPTLTFKFGLDDKTVSFIQLEEVKETHEEWTNLNFEKCQNCPLNESQVKQCPIAKNLNHLTFFFKDTKSFKKSMIFVETEERAYAKNASIQEGLFSIFGVIMATSDCPHMNFLKPMARFHLPFSTPEETMFRAYSTFLLKEYLNENYSRDVLNQLFALYKETQMVNDGILARIRKIAKGDANQNAVIILNNFTQIMEVDRSTDLSMVKEMFKNICLK